MEKKPKLVVQLPIDIEFEILSRLPIKSLMRFRCVSKPWNALISTSSFQLQHFNHHSPHTPFPLITTTSANTNLIRINHFDAHLPLVRSRDVTPTNSCRGLVCLLNSAKDRVFICNPSTREILELPPMPIGGASRYVTLCYASASNRFKVVNFFEDLSQGRKSPTKCRVFTLGTAAWRDISCPLPHNKYYFSGDDPLLHDTIHFLPAEDGDVSVHCFHIETEEFTEIPLPDELLEGTSLWQARYLMELGGFLALNFHYGDTLDIWLLKDRDEEEWVKEYHIHIHLTDTDAISPVAILPDGSLLLNVEDTDESNPSTWVLRRYDPVLGKIGNTLQKDCRLGMQCVESCFSPSPRLM